MTTHSTKQIPDVGAADPELKNSLVMSQLDPELEGVEQAAAGMDVCYFNGEAYDKGQFVYSGSEVLRCEGGVWYREGIRDGDNP